MLHFKIFPDSISEQQLAGSIPVIFIPGLFGSIVNWRSFVGSLSLHNPIMVIDQRNHGRSPHYPSNTYLDMVTDLLQLLDGLKIAKAILVGHSMGGKVAMLFSLLHPQRVVKQLVVDVAPVAYPDVYSAYLKKMLEIDITQVRSRKEVDRQLESTITDKQIRLFLLQNLTGHSNQYHWRLNLPVLYENMAEIIDFPDDKVREKVNNSDSLFIAGGLSEYVLPEHYPVIRQYFPNVNFKTIADAGHWVHVEQRKKLSELLTEFVNFKNNE